MEGLAPSMVTASEPSSTHARNAASIPSPRRYARDKPAEERVACARRVDDLDRRRGGRPAALSPSAATAPSLAALERHDVEEPRQHRAAPAARLRRRAPPPHPRSGKRAAPPRPVEELFGADLLQERIGGRDRRRRELFAASPRAGSPARPRADLPRTARSRRRAARSTPSSKRVRQVGAAEIEVRARGR